MLVIFLLFSLVSSTFQLAFAQTGDSLSEPPSPQMGDVSHALLAEHAALSFGLTPQQADWVSQGAWDEDHCAVDIYPPSGPLCFPAIPSGHHSWDPDANLFWNEPEWWGDFGSGLRRASLLFKRAVAAYQDGQEEAAYLWLGRAMHLFGDMATPAHVLLDTHIPGDSDKYESWLSSGNQEKTLAWISANPPGIDWHLDINDLPDWELLTDDVQTQLEMANQVYGERETGKQLWQLGPQDEDPILFRLMFFIAEEADNWDSNDVLGETNHGQLDDDSYLMAMRDTLFPVLIWQSTALISYFFQVVQPPQPPNLVSPTDGAWIEKEMLQFNWQETGFNPEYILQLAAEPQFDQLLIDFSTRSTSFTPESQLNEGTYYWRVRISTNYGESGWSPIWSFNVMWRMSMPVVCRFC
jgi:hypothetical protein